MERRKFIILVAGVGPMDHGLFSKLLAETNGTMTELNLAYFDHHRHEEERRLKMAREMLEFTQPPELLPHSLIDEYADKPEHGRTQVKCRHKDKSVIWPKARKKNKAGRKAARLNRKR